MPLRLPCVVRPTSWRCPWWGIPRSRVCGAPRNHAERGGAYREELRRVCLLWCEGVGGFASFATPAPPPPPGGVDPVPTSFRSVRSFAHALSWGQQGCTHPATHPTPSHPHQPGPHKCWSPRLSLIHPGMGRTEQQREGGPRMRARWRQIGGWLASPAAALPPHVARRCKPTGEMS